MTIKADRVGALPLVESMTIKVVRENRNPRDHQIRVGDLIRIVNHDPTMAMPLAAVPHTLGLVTEMGEPATCPDYVIAVFPHLGETVVYADEWEVINV